MSSGTRPSPHRILYVHAIGGPPPDVTLPALARHGEITTYVAFAPAPHVREVIQSHSRALVASDVALPLVDDIVNAARHIKAEAIFTTSEFAILAVAQACEALGLRGPGPNVAKARNKVLMRQCWDAAGVPGPQYHEIGSMEDMLALRERFERQFVLKDPWGSGGVGTQLIDVQDDLAAVWQNTQTVLGSANHAGRRGLLEQERGHTLLAEAVLEGAPGEWFDEDGYADFISVEGLVIAGVYHPVAVTSRLRTLPPFCETASMTPCGLSQADERAVIDLARRAVDAQQLRHAGTHTEIKLMPGRRMALLESSARLGGAAIIKQVREVFGIDMADLLMAVLLGKPVEVPLALSAHARGAAGGLILHGAASDGRPWQQPLPLDAGTVPWHRLVGEEISVTAEPLQSPAAGTPVQPYVPAHGLMNGWGVLYVQSKGRSVVRPCLQIMDGLESVLDGTPLFADLFGNRLRETPRQTAVQCGEQSLSYEALDAAANGIASRLSALGIGRGDIVAVFMERQALLVASLLAIGKLGAAYMPMDPTYPVKRLRHMLDQSGACAILTMPAHLPDATTLPTGKSPLPVIDCSRLPPARSFASTQLHAYDLAYVIFTSGTTGMPKGVMVEHGGLANHLRAKVKDLALTQNDRVAQTASHCFDISIWQMLAPLTVGGTCVVVPSAELADPQSLASTLASQRISVAQFVPSLLAAFIDGATLSPKGLPQLRCISTVGEPLPPLLCAQWFARLPQVPILNHYGPTECADGVTHHLVEASHDFSGAYVAIGEAIAGLRTYVAIENDGVFELAATCAVGELLVAGVGVARGYINDPERTASAFLSNPFDDHPRYARVYRTGDLVRRRPDGLLECIGRADRQVKVRGHRIELAEIEAVLQRHPGVESCAVVLEQTPQARVKRMARQVLASSVGDPRSVARLVGYVRSRTPTTRASLVDHLRDQLPAHMVPDLFFEVDNWPLNPNGKLNHQRLPAPCATRPVTDRPFRAPVGTTETTLAEIWRELLSLERVGADDLFLELGGDSLRGMQAINRIQRQFGRRLTVRQLYEQPLADVAHFLDAEAGHAGTPAPLVRGSVTGERAPLSHVQRHLWFLWKLQPKLPNYTLQVSLDCSGALGTDRVSTAWRQAVARFDTLRLRFAEDEDGPYLRIAREDLSPPVVHALESLDEPAAARFAEELARSERALPFDLLNGPLHRVQLLSWAPGRCTLLLTTHEIIMDAWSLSVLARDLQQRLAGDPHAALAHGAEPGFADYARWEQAELTQERLQPQAAFWREQLSGNLPEPLTLGDKPRPSRMNHRTRSLGLNLTAPTAQALRALARHHETTLFCAVLACFYLLLQRYSGQDDLIVGTPKVVRDQPGTEHLLGFFLNMLPLRARPNDEHTFQDFVRAVHANTADASSHASYPFSWMVETLGIPRNSHVSPVFQVMFNMYSEQSEAEDTDSPVVVVAREHEMEHGKYDLTLYSQEEGEQLYLQLTWCEQLFSDDHAARMLHALQQIVERVVARPQATLREVSALPPAEFGYLRAFNGDPVAWPQADLRELLLARIAASNESICYSWASGGISYRALGDRIHQMSHALLERGLVAGDRLLIGDDRGIDVICLQLACICLGVTYLCVPTDEPLARLQDIVADACPRFALLPCARSPESAAVSALCTVFPLEDVLARSQSHPTAPPPHRVAPAQVLHIVYTSGSSGKPKGVLIPSTACINRLRWMWHAHPFQATDKGVVQKASSLVASSWEILGPLLQGIPSLILSARELRDPALLLQRLHDESVSHLLCSPPILQGLVNARSAGGPAAPHLRLITSSAEPLPHALAQAFRAHFPAARLYNFYGSTECSSNATWHEVDSTMDDVDANVPIGKPLSNVNVCVVDEQLRLLPRGVAGELAVAGDCLALGYLNDEADATASFVTNPWPLLLPAGSTLYRTGDRARFNERGQLVLLGRQDNQVKIHGYRVNLGEVERALAGLPGVKEAAAHLFADGEGGPWLIGYVIRDEVLAPLEHRAIALMLARHLPPHAVPRQVIALPRLPRLKSGKLDRRALPLPAYAPPAAPATNSFTSDIEHRLAQVWSSVLRLPGEPGPDSDFFRLGGTSMLSVRCVAQAAKSGLRFSVSDLYDCPVLSELARRIGATEAVHVLPRDARTESPAMTPSLRFLSEEMGFDELYNMPGIWLDTDERIDPIALHQAVLNFTRDYAMARTRLLRPGPRQPLKLRVTPEPLSLEFEPLGSFEQEQAFKEAVTQRTAAIQRSFRFDGHTPLARFVLFNGDIAGSAVRCFFLVLHHFLIDGYGFRLMLDELERYCAAAGQPVAPVYEDRVAVDRWVSALARRVADASSAEVAYWTSQRWDLLAFDDARPLSSESGDPATRWNGLNEGGAQLYQHMVANDLSGDAFETICAQRGICVFDLDTASSTSLLALQVQRDGIDAFDVLLSTLVEVAGHGHASKGLFIDSMSMGRTGTQAGCDTSTALSFVTELIPMPLVVDLAHGARERARTVRHTRSTMPHDGIGLRAVRYLLGNDGASEVLSALPWPRTIVNYRVPLGGARGRTLLGLSEAKIWTGEFMHTNRHHVLRFNIDKVDGRLRFFMAYDKQHFSRRAARELERQLLDRLVLAACDITGPARDRTEALDEQ